MLLIKFVGKSFLLPFKLIVPIFPQSTKTPVFSKTSEETIPSSINFVAIPVSSAYVTIFVSLIEFEITFPENTIFARFCVEENVVFVNVLLPLKSTSPSKI